MKKKSLFLTTQVIKSDFPINFTKKKNGGGLLLPDFNTYDEILVTQNNVVLPSG